MKTVREVTTYDVLLREWFESGDALPLARHMDEIGDMDRLSVWCRAGLDGEEDEERREEFLRLLGKTAQAPEQWNEALDAFAENPSEEAWDALFEWVPLEDSFHRLQSTVRRLRTRGVDPDLLFTCGSRLANTSEVIALADSGAASPGAILARGEESNIRPFYTALAAHSAAARGDQQKAVWLANRAGQQGRAAGIFDLVGMQVMALSRELDEAHQAMLDERFEPLLDPR